jgi:hypothetical protein
MPLHPWDHHGEGARGGEAHAVAEERGAALGEALRRACRGTRLAACMGWDGRRQRGPDAKRNARDNRDCCWPEGASSSWHGGLSPMATIGMEGA